MRRILFVLSISLLSSHLEANCPRCAKIEAERTAHPLPEAGYYETPPHPSPAPSTEAEKTHNP